MAEKALPVVGLNVRIGDTVGCAAIPTLADQAKRDIEDAIDLAEDIGAGAIHVLAGRAEGREPFECYLRTLRFALDHTSLNVLIEPVCTEQLPGYFLRTVEQATTVVDEVDHPRLKILFDCYHVYRESGSLLANFQKVAPQVGHVQIASA